MMLTQLHDIRPEMERRSPPLLASLESYRTAPLETALPALVLLVQEHGLDVALYCLAKALGHFNEVPYNGPLAQVHWHQMGRRSDGTWRKDTRRDCWEIRTVCLDAVFKSNVGTPMHRYGGDPSCSESIVRPWMPTSPDDPVLAFAEAVAYECGISGLIDGYDWIALNKPLRAQGN